ncbi:rRNA maturation RNase YbeY [Candidatus Nomurabacteria bacterium]|nr:rRNA maturation RNase YbeY [Candidatus Nomurabacteria bacterium]
MSANFSLVNQTKGKIPSLPILALKEDILGKKYSLSFAYVTPKISQEINKKYRSKDKPTNVLSFCLSKNEGEIVICPAVVKRESKDKTKNFNKNFKELLGFLVIHGMLHLKGMQHSSRMDKAEAKYDKKYFYRNRRGLRHHQSGSGRISKRRKKS